MLSVVAGGKPKTAHYEIQFELNISVFHFIPFVSLSMNY